MSHSYCRKVIDLLEMIKFSHTVFAFPFALMGAVLASMTSGTVPTVMQLVWICVAMVGARTGAMGLNRVIDARIDAKNPRTSNRHIPAGKVRLFEAWLLIAGAFALMLVAAWQLNPLCLQLAPIAIVCLALYSYCKRFTALAHLVLGFCLAAAPVGAWIALRGDIGWPVVVLGFAVLFWVAGFDIFYALQDVDYDQMHGLHSIPSRFGIKRAFQAARAFHLIMLILLVILAFAPGLGWIYLTGVAVVGLLLIYEHRLVHPDDLSRLNAAFFNMNGYISITIFSFTLLDALF
ncbi:MAG: UbiA family prenyltransferase [Deltaproteobacteria bacterium]|jgi:4-hydroxybenzoate polyprenyltransferase|nr:UbiA family prenyltransferase [Deltaproteobacteria bacterium]